MNNNNKIIYIIPYPTDVEDKGPWHSPKSRWQSYIWHFLPMVKETISTQCKCTRSNSKIHLSNVHTNTHTYIWFQHFLHSGFSEFLPEEFVLIPSVV